MDYCYLLHTMHFFDFTFQFDTNIALPSCHHLESQRSAKSDFEISVKEIGPFALAPRRGDVVVLEPVPEDSGADVDAVLASDFDCILGSGEGKNERDDISLPNIISALFEFAFQKFKVGTNSLNHLISSVTATPPFLLSPLYEMRSRIAASLALSCPIEGTSPASATSLSLIWLGVRSWTETSKYSTWRL